MVIGVYQSVLESELRGVKILTDLVARYTVARRAYIVWQTEVGMTEVRLR
jgi:hypothetical protein